MNFSDLELQEQLKEMSENNFWLKLANYEISSIIQGKSYQKYFQEYTNQLNVIWWSNLRLGNWKRFMDTLETYAYNNSFQLYTGTSGVVRKPDGNDPRYKTDLTFQVNVYFDLQTDIIHHSVVMAEPWYISSLNVSKVQLSAVF